MSPNLLTHQSKDPLHGVLVDSQQMRHRPLGERWQFLNPCLDRLSKTSLHLRLELDRSVIHRAARHLEPAARLRNRDGDAFFFKFLADGLDHFLCPTPFFALVTA